MELNRRTCAFVRISCASMYLSVGMGSSGGNLIPLTLRKPYTIDVDGVVAAESDPILPNATLTPLYIRQKHYVLPAMD